MYIGIRVKYPVTLVGFWKKSEIWLWIFEKSFKFHENRPVGAELFGADRETEGQTDLSNLIVAFRNFANAPKMDCKHIWQFLGLGSSGSA